MRSFLLTLMLSLTASGAAVAAAPTTGASLYDNNCALCHQQGGVGSPGQFPKLSGRIAAVAAKPEGRAYLGQVVLNGMSGKIVVSGTPMMGVMPGFPQLSNADVASILNYLTTLPPAGREKVAKFTANEVEKLRKIPMASQQISTERGKLVDANVLR